MPRAKRPLRSNAVPIPTVVAPPPEALRNHFFTKDFGIHGVFVGACVGVKKGAHKHTGDDLYCLQYG